MANPAPNSPNARGRKARAETPLEPSAAPAAIEEQLDERAEEHEAAAASPEAAAATPTETEKQRILEQLEALHRRELELRRDLVIADHPELRASLRALTKAANGLAAIDAKVSGGLSKSDARRKATLEKQHAAFVARRAEIDARIAELDAELTTLGQALAESQSERRNALLALGALLVEHGPPIKAAGLDLTALLPGLAAWREDILAIGPTLESDDPS